MLCIVTKKKTRLLKQRGYIAFVDAGGHLGELDGDDWFFRRPLSSIAICWRKIRCCTLRQGFSVRREGAQETKLVCRMAAPPQQVLEPKTKEGSQQPTEQLPQERKPTPSAAKQEGVRRRERADARDCTFVCPPRRTREITKSQAVSGDFWRGAAGLLSSFWIHRSWSAHRSGCGLPSINRFTVSWSESSGPRMWSWWSRNGSGCAFLWMIQKSVIFVKGFSYFFVKHPLACTEEMFYN